MIQKQCFNWVKKHKETHSINFRSCQWIQEILPHFYSYNVNMKINGRDCPGHSTETSENDAMFIAFAESVERAIFAQENLSTTNGCAIHSSRAKASQSAENELLERDTFLHAFLNGHRFPTFKLRLRDYKTKKIIKLLKCHADIKIVFYKLLNRKKVPVYVARVIFHKYDKGSIWGLGYSPYHALKELSRNACLVIKVPTESLRLEDFYKIEKASFIDHYKLALNFEYDQEISKHIDHGKPYVSPPPLKRPIKVKTYDIKKYGLTGLPFKFSYACSDEVIQLYTGSKDLNGKDIMPHPLG